MTWTLPSSIFTGKWTVNSRRHSRRTCRRPGSRSSLSAARANCCCATFPGWLRGPRGAVSDGETRLAREDAADGRLGAADAPAALEVLERLEDDVEAAVGPSGLGIRHHLPGGGAGPRPG